VVSLKVAAYARVSTSDKDQDPETQLVALRDFARLQQWEIVGEYVDRAPANDPLHRTAWRRLLDDAAKRRFQSVVCFKLDRCFRSVKHMHDTLAVWEAQGVGFVSAREGFDTRTALGRLLLNLLASLAEFELEVLSERVRAGMDRAKRQGVHVGRPPVTARAGFDQRWREIRPELAAGQISRSEAARRLQVGYASLLRLLAAEKGAEVS
jgi:DNA invertase Pin-like site-specific DNA recombinase